MTFIEVHKTRSPARAIILRIDEIHKILDCRNASGHKVTEIELIGQPDRPNFPLIVIESYESIKAKLAEGGYI